MNFSDFTIDPGLPLDLSQQIADKLGAAIRSGALVAGERLLGDKALARLFGVSHMTVRKALSTLVEQGLIVKQRSRGTFVASPEVLAQKRGARRYVHFIYVSEFGFFAEAARGMSQELNRHGLELVLRDVSGWTVDEVKSFAASLTGDDVAGLIIYPHLHSPEEMSALQRQMIRQRTPVVFLNLGGEAGVEAVMGDSSLGVALGIRHLYALGHRRLGYIESESFWQMQHHRDRREGFLRTCRELGVSVFEHFTCPAPTNDEICELEEVIRFYQAGIMAFSEALASLTGIVCYNDAVALALWHAAEDKGLSVPGDLSIVGFDNREIAQTPAYPLTTVDGRMHKVGTLAARRLVRLIDQGIGDPSQEYVTPKLIVRGSTGPSPERERVFAAGEETLSRRKEG